jgi:hypothetical protein
MSKCTSSAVMNQRSEPTDALDDFPTPPWATRALIVSVICDSLLGHKSVWEPACNRGLMSGVLAEYFNKVHASDVHDYGIGAHVGSFIGEGSDIAHCWYRPSWIITNPPFNSAEQFLQRALIGAGEGVALLLRSNWAEGVGRYERIFSQNPPDVIAQFCERVAMHKGQWVHDGSTATSYSWFVWYQNSFNPHNKMTQLAWIPPGTRKALTRPDDISRFGGISVKQKKELEL